MPFELQTFDRHTLVQLKGKCGLEDIARLEKSVVSLMKTRKEKYFLFQCESCDTMSVDFIKCLSKIHQSLKPSEGSVCLVSPNRFVRQVLAQIGMDKALPQNLSLQGAMTLLGIKPKNSLDVKFINPFLVSTLRVFELQCAVKAKLGKVRIKTAQDKKFMGEVSGIISLQEESFHGILSLSLSLEVFKHLAKSMLSEDVASVSEDNHDIAAELSNMVLGGAKKELSTLGYNLKPTLPSSVFGTKRSNMNLEAESAIIVPFESTVGNFWIEIISTKATAEKSLKASQPLLKKAS